jgi:D-glycero-D-manno-heptose 1,7-bisphosphate phosphatase
VFLDRDGVLVQDNGVLTDPRSIRLIPDIAEALRRLANAGFKLIVVSNQSAVARGLMTEEEVRALQKEIEAELARAGAPPLDAFYFCPHHPNATLENYRAECACRKPRPGLLQQAASEHGLDLAATFMIGDRLTDAMAGARAGCRTVLVETGQHTAPLIQMTDPMDPDFRPDFRCADLLTAADWILKQ